MQIKRGDIWYIDRGTNSGSEQTAVVRVQSSVSR